jgi:hypothetical protein
LQPPVVNFTSVEHTWAGSLPVHHTVTPGAGSTWVHTRRLVSGYDYTDPGATTEDSEFDMESDRDGIRPPDVHVQPWMRRELTSHTVIDVPAAVVSGESQGRRTLDGTLDPQAALQQGSRVMSVSAVGTLVMKDKAASEEFASHGDNVRDWGGNPSALQGGRMKERTHLTRVDSSSPAYRSVSPRHDQAVAAARRALQAYRWHAAGQDRDLTDGGPGHRGVALRLALDTAQFMEGSASTSREMWTAWALAHRDTARLDAQHDPAHVWATKVDTRHTARLLGDVAALRPLDPEAEAQAEAAPGLGSMAPPSREQADAGLRALHQLVSCFKTTPHAQPSSDEEDSECSKSWVQVSIGCSATGLSSSWCTMHCDLCARPAGGACANDRFCLLVIVCAGCVGSAPTTCVVYHMPNVRALPHVCSLVCRPLRTPPSTPSSPTPCGLC